MCQVWLKLALLFLRKFFLSAFSLFHNYLPLKMVVALHLDKCESPSPKNALCQVWLKLAKWFLRRRFSNFVNVFSLFRNYLSLEKGLALYFLLTQGCFVPSLVEIISVVLEKKEKKIFLNSVNVFSLFHYYLPLEKSVALHLKKLDSSLFK